MQLLTASRMASQLACPRQHYWRYERGLQRLADSAALAFGTSWHAALEARSRGADLTAQLAAAVGAAQVDELQVATLGALLAGYGVRYATDSFADQELPEIAFDL